MTGPVWSGQGEDPWLPQRVESLLNAAQAERSIYAAVWDALSGWLVTTSRRVLGAPVPQPEAIFAQVPAWERAVDGIILDSILPVMGWAYTGLFGPDFAWHERPNTLAYLAGVRNRMVRTPDEVFNLVAGQLASGVTLGEGIPELTERVEEVLSTTQTERWPNRAVVIARTECLTGDAIVQSDGIKAVYRRWYQGDVFRVDMSSGDQLTATPNHPILTSRGWVGAGDLMPGDDLLCHAGGQGLRASGDVNIGRVPASIAELYDALSAVGVVIRTKTGKPDFHGDGADGYVDVATTDRHLIDRLQGSKHGCYLGLELSYSRLTSLHGARQLLSVGSYASRSHDSQRAKSTLYSIDTDPKFFRKISGACSFGVAGCHGVYVDINPSRALPPEKVKLGALGRAQAANRLPSVGEYGSDPSVVDAERLRYRLDPLSRPVGADHVLRIDRIRFSGHVYNLTTQRGWFGVGSYYSGNTMGALNGSRFDAFSAWEEEDEDDVEYERLWLSTIDSRTRPTHVAADQQRTGVNDPFMVGGVPLMFPGDPAGPAAECVQCRCTTLLLEKGESVDLSSRQLKKEE